MQGSDGLQSVCQVHGGNQFGKLFGGPIMLQYIFYMYNLYNIR